MSDEVKTIYTASKGGSAILKIELVGQHVRLSMTEDDFCIHFSAGEAEVKLNHFMSVGDITTVIEYLNVAKQKLIDDVK